MFCAKQNKTEKSGVKKTKRRIKKTQIIFLEVVFGHHFFRRVSSGKPLVLFSAENISSPPLSRPVFLASHSSPTEAVLLVDFFLRPGGAPTHTTFSDRFPMFDASWPGQPKALNLVDFFVPGWSNPPHYIF